jgi:hypothetical protein
MTQCSSDAGKKRKSNGRKPWISVLVVISEFSIQNAGIYLIGVVLCCVLCVSVSERASFLRLLECLHLGLPCCYFCEQKGSGRGISINTPTLLFWLSLSAFRLASTSPTFRPERPLSRGVCVGCVGIIVVFGSAWTASQIPESVSR